VRVEGSCAPAAAGAGKGKLGSAAGTREGAPAGRHGRGRRRALPGGALALTGPGATVARPRRMRAMAWQVLDLK